MRIKVMRIDNNNRKLIMMKNNRKKRMGLNFHLFPRIKVKLNINRKFYHLINCSKKMFYTRERLSINWFNDKELPKNLNNPS